MGSHTPTSMGDVIGCIFMPFLGITEVSLLPGFPLELPLTDTHTHTEYIMCAISSTAPYQMHCHSLLSDLYTVCVCVLCVFCLYAAVSMFVFVDLVPSLL